MDGHPRIHAKSLSLTNSLQHLFPFMPGAQGAACGEGAVCPSTISCARRGGRSISERIKAVGARLSGKQFSNSSRRRADAVHTVIDAGTVRTHPILYESNGSLPRTEISNDILLVVKRADQS